MKLQEYTIDYGFSVAKLTTPFSKKDAIGRFYHLAGQCFGIRKSITEDPRVVEVRAGSFPDWVSERAHEMLIHNLTSGFPDTIIWDAEGNKIKDEWD